MPADPLSTVARGRPMRITADTWNEVVRATRKVRDWQKDPKATAGERYGCVVALATNDTGADLAAYSPAGVSGVAVYDISGDDAAEWQRDAGLTLKKPADDTAWVAVTLEPIPAGGIGRVAVAGVAVCNVEVTDVGHRYASPAAGDTTRLHSGATGSIRLLYIAAGGGSTRRCVVVVGDQVGDGTAGDPFELVTGNFLDGEYNWFSTGTDRVAADLDSGLWFRGGSLISLLPAQIDQAGGVAAVEEWPTAPVNPEYAVQDLGNGNKRVNGVLHLRDGWVRHDELTPAVTIVGGAVTLWDVPRSVGPFPSYAAYAFLRDGNAGGGTGDGTGVQYAVVAGTGGGGLAALTLAAGSGERGVGTNLANWVGAGRPGLPGNHGFAAYGLSAGGIGWHYGAWGVMSGPLLVAGGLVIRQELSTSPPPPPPPPPKSPAPALAPPPPEAPYKGPGLGAKLAAAKTRIELAKAMGRRVVIGDDGLVYEERVSGGVAAMVAILP